VAFSPSQSLVRIACPTTRNAVLALGRGIEPVVPDQPDDA
jgi:hypothetical protein